jgi:hypothetical protein
MWTLLLTWLGRWFNRRFDPRGTGLLRPRYRPLQHPAYRAAEEADLAARLNGPHGDQLHAKLAAARARPTEIIE